MLSCGSNAGMETPGLLVSGIVNHTLFHCCSHTKQTLPQMICAHPVFLSGRLFAELCCRFCNLEVHRGDHDLLDYCTFGVEAVNDAQNVRVDTARTKDHDQQNLSKKIM